MRLHTPKGEPTRWLFDEGGKPWHDNLVDYRGRATRTAAAVSCKLHELQHYFASGLIAAGCDVVTVQAAMPRIRHDDAQHVRPSLADGRGQDAGGRLRDGGGGSCHASATQGGSVGL